MPSRLHPGIALHPAVVLGAIVLSGWSCTGAIDRGDDASGGSGQSSGGSVEQSAGGNQATGGNIPGSGGGAPGSGGSQATGGANPTGGSQASGGRAGTGGAQATGGTAQGSGGIVQASGGTGGTAQATGGTAQGTGGTTQGTGGTTQGTGGTAGTPVPPGEPAELAGITEAHNRERRTLNLPDLAWDPALAQIAKTWAAQCIDTTAPVGLIDHNPDRAKGYDGSVGENIYGTTGTPTGEQAVTSWINEKNDYDYASNTCAAMKVCGHYTQVVWKATTKVGCAFQRCASLKYSGTIVCDYSPAGNVIGRKPY